MKQQVDVLEAQEEVFKKVILTVYRKIKNTANKRDLFLCNKRHVVTQRNIYVCCI